mgnify:CR=1 FL=1
MPQVLLAVSGTLQDGFELRKNLDVPGAPAVLIGDAVVRGVRAHLDIKNEGAREWVGPPAFARVNPACVVTGDERDANLYAVYLVDERAVLRALIGEPRYLAIAPDCARVDLSSPQTSREVRSLLLAAARRLHGGAPAVEPDQAAILTVVTTYAAPSFVPVPQTLPLGDAGSSARMSSFPAGLASFAGIPLERVREPGAADAALRAAEARLDRSATAAAQAVLCSGPSAPPQPPLPWRPRLAEAWDAPTVASLACAAGFADGSAGDALAALAAPAADAPAADAPAADELSVESAQPRAFAWPRGRLALLMIDWQRDFLDPTGFGAALGNDVTPLRNALGPAAAVLGAARSAGVPVLHTLEAHEADLADCPPAKKRRCAAIGTTLDAALGRVLVRGEPGNAIVPEVAPLPGEALVHKPGKGAFYGTDLEAQLRRLGVTHLLLTGVTTEVCVQTTMREANDRGFDCLLVRDATESYFAHFKAATLEMIVAQGAIVGWTADSAEVVAALGQARDKTP